MATMVSGIAPRSGLGFAELDELPKRVILGLSAATTGPYACSLRAERNTYRTLHEQASAKARRLEAELADARGACQSMNEALRDHERKAGIVEVDGFTVHGDQRLGAVTRWDGDAQRRCARLKKPNV